MKHRFKYSVEEEEEKEEEEEEEEEEAKDWYLASLRFSSALSSSPFRSKSRQRRGFELT